MIIGGLNGNDLFSLLLRSGVIVTPLRGVAYEKSSLYRLLDGSRLFPLEALDSEVRDLLERDRERVVFVL
jgi:hypothetical protein